MAISLSEFVKFYPLRAKGIACFFGAGTSISAGVPSAYDLTWDFKRRIYCAEQAYPLHLFNNLTDSGLRDQIQNYFDVQGGCPKFESPEEYSYYFERAFSSGKDRSEYIIQQTSGMQLTYGHKVIGILLKNQLINLIFTTNFDKAFENTISSQLSNVENWYAADLDNSDNGMKYFQSGKRPLVVKLHGDYFSNNLKNTSLELQNHDKNLRDILSVSLDTNGLCVMGYSGRDKSVMDVLNEAVNKTTSFSNGLFWFVKSGTLPLPEVINLINNAKAQNKEAEIIEIETFDTAWGEIVKGFNNLPVGDVEKLNESYTRISNQPLNRPGKKYPLIRLNALPLTKYPATARLYKTNAGNTKEVKDLISNAGVPILGIRKYAGIVGFGSDDDFKKAFSNYGACEFDLFQIHSRDLANEDPSIKGLITAALLQALVNGMPLRTSKRRDRCFLFPDPKKINDKKFADLRKVFGNISGIIPNTTLTWVIALEITIQHALSESFVLLSPTLIASKTIEKKESSLIAPFIKEFTARWYNQKYDEILSAWIKFIFNENKEIEIATYMDGMNGVNAFFRLLRTTAFTRTN